MQLLSETAISFYFQQKTSGLNSEMERDMGPRERALTAYCGLFCGDCIRYKSKASDLASQLINELVKINFEDYSKIKRKDVKELGNYEEMMSALEAIRKLKCSTPCRLGGDGCCQPCEIAKCVRSKGIEGCWECTDREYEACDKFEFLRPFHGDAR